MKYNIRIHLFLLLILFGILSHLSNLRANDQAQLTISVSGADQGSNTNNYYVAVPTDGSTDTITITGGGASLDANDCSLTCTNCSGGTVDATSDSGGQISYNFNATGPNGEDTGTQSGQDGDGSTITLSVDDNTGPGTYSYSLQSVSEDFICPSGSASDGSGTGDAEDDQGSQSVNVIVYSVTTKTFQQAPANTNNARTEIGVGEFVTVNINPNTLANGATISSDNLNCTSTGYNYSGIMGFNALDQQGSANITVSFDGVDSEAIGFTIDIPQSEQYQSHVNNNIINGSPLSTNQIGVNAIYTARVLPDRVSFANVLVIEVPGPVTSTWGNFAANGWNVPHTPTSYPIQLDPKNQFDDYVGFYISMPIAASYLRSTGGAYYDIPINWQLTQAGTIHSDDIDDVNSYKFIIDTHGTAQVQKFGQNSDTRSFSQ